MKVSKHINKLAWINIKKKSQRTLLSIISVGLSVTIIFTSLTLFKNVYSLSKNVEYEEIGNIHYAVASDDLVEPNTRHSITYDYDSHMYALVNDVVINFREIIFHELNAENPEAFGLIEGHYPSNTNEIVLDETLGYNIGDNVSFDVGEIGYKSDETNVYRYNQSQMNQVDNTETKSYTVVGLYRNNETMEKLTNGISIAYTLIDEKDSFVTYVKDSRIEMSDQYEKLLERFNVNENQVFYNNDVVSLDVVKNYLQDTTILLAMFVIIAVIALLVSLITIQNIILMSDKERRKELGLLKSIGATPNEVRRLLITELLLLGVIGSVVGLVLGSIISYIVLSMFISSLYVTLTISMVLNPILLIVAFVIGVGLMLSSGMKMYSKYISSYPIFDLKDTTYQYETPEKQTTTKNRTFAWKMFIIYNGRMKAQTKNIFRSFSLFMFTMILFFAVLLSNMIYKNAYKSSDYDFELTNFEPLNASTLGNPYADIDYDVTSKIYGYYNEGTINADSIYVMRRLQSATLYSPTSALPAENVKLFQTRTSSEVTTTSIDGKSYSTIQGTAGILDATQIEALKSQEVIGDLDNLSEQGAIVVLYGNANKELYGNLKLGDPFYLGSTEVIVDVIVYMNEDSIKDKMMYFDYEGYPRVVAVSSENQILTELIFKNHAVLERTYITLANKSSVSMVADLLDEILMEEEVVNRYVYSSDLLVVESNKFTSFMIESLLYPLFLMLFIISVININNVMVSNVHLKRSDVSIMKSVGMTNFQLQLLFSFEYIEGYLNAAFLSIAIFVPICILEAFLKLASAFSLSDNIFATIIISLFTVGIFVIVPLAYISLKRISSILPIENMKDVA